MLRKQPHWRAADVAGISTREPADPATSTTTVVALLISLLGILALAAVALRGHAEIGPRGTIGRPGDLSPMPGKRRTMARQIEVPLTSKVINLTPSLNSVDKRALEEALKADLFPSPELLHERLGTPAIGAERRIVSLEVRDAKKKSSNDFEVAITFVFEDVDSGSLVVAKYQGDWVVQIDPVLGRVASDAIFENLTRVDTPAEG